MKEKSISVSAVLILIWTHICTNRPAMMGGFLICPSSLTLSFFPSICAIFKNRKVITIQILLPPRTSLAKRKDESVETTPAKIVGKSNPFKSTLKANEIKLLTDCMNEANMFTTTVSAKILTDFFNCKLNGVLKVNNTRLLAYLMMQLSCYNYIVYEWQSVIANNKLILKKIKGEPLTRTDLSSATDQAKNIYPKGYEIIDKYIKQLKKG